MLCALIGLLAGACSDDDDPNEADEKPVLEVDDATCLLVEGAFEPVVSELPVIDCNISHTHEIIARVEVPAEVEVYPGFAQLESIAELECYTEFEPYVGISPFDSNLFISWLVPTLDSWNDEGDREILCVVGRFDGGELDKSVYQTQL